MSSTTTKSDAPTKTKGGTGKKKTASSGTKKSNEVAAAAIATATTSPPPPPSTKPASSPLTASHIAAMHPASSTDIAAHTRDALVTREAEVNAYLALHSLEKEVEKENEVDKEVDDEEPVEEDEETMRQQMEEMLKEQTSEPCSLTLDILKQRTLPRDLLTSSDQSLITRKLEQLERIYLDGLNLSSLGDVFVPECSFVNSLTHLYLQRNVLTSMHELSVLINLKFLCASHNRIRVVEGLDSLHSLVFLDLRYNLIEVLDTGDVDDEDSVCQLPESLIILKLAGNPFVEEDLDKEYVEHIVTVQPYLKELDQLKVTRKMRKEFGLDVDEDDGEEEGEEEKSEQPTSRSSVPELSGDLESATEELRQTTEDIKKRSQQRMAQFDEDRDEALREIRSRMGSRQRVGEEETKEQL